MKKILFALPILALGFFATYCTKENAPAPATTPTINVDATNRDGKDPETCSVTITANGSDITICGLVNNSDPCLSCNGESLLGTETIPAGTAKTYNVALLFPDVPFYLKNNTNKNATVAISTNAIPTQTWALPPGQCNSYGLATTCFLFADRAPIN